MYVCMYVCMIPLEYSVRRYIFKELYYRGFQEQPQIIYFTNTVEVLLLLPPLQCLSVHIQTMIS